VEFIPRAISDGVNAPVWGHPMRPLLRLMCGRVARFKYTVPDELGPQPYSPPLLPETSTSYNEPESPNPDFAGASVSGTGKEWKDPEGFFSSPGRIDYVSETRCLFSSLVDPRKGSNPPVDCPREVPPPLLSSPPLPPPPLP